MTIVWHDTEKHIAVFNNEKRAGNSWLSFTFSWEMRQLILSKLGWALMKVPWLSHRRFNRSADAFITGHRILHGAWHMSIYQFGARIYDGGMAK